MLCYLDVHNMQAEVIRAVPGFEPISARLRYAHASTNCAKATVSE